MRIEGFLLAKLVQDDIALIGGIPDQAGWFDLPPPDHLLGLIAEDPDFLQPFIGVAKALRQQRQDPDRFNTNSPVLAEIKPNPGTKVWYDLAKLWWQDQDLVHLDGRLSSPPFNGYISYGYHMGYSRPYFDGFLVGNRRLDVPNMRGSSVFGPPLANVEHPLSQPTPEYASLALIRTAQVQKDRFRLLGAQVFTEELNTLARPPVSLGRVSALAT
jgi:hypothetical protein